MKRNQPEPDSFEIPTGAVFARRLAVFYAALFVALGVQLPFLPVWLAAKGLDVGTIGIVLAIPMIVRILAIPVAARAADRQGTLRGAIVIAAAAATVGYVAIGLAEGAVAIMVALAVASAFYTPIMPLADAYALRGLGRRKRPYGPVRLWGSAAFIAGSLGAGLLLDFIPARNLIWLVTASLAVTAVAAWALEPVQQTAAADAAGPVSARSLLRDRSFLAVAAAASLIQGSHAVYYGFSTLEWRSAGIGGGTIGMLWALGVAAEIVLFAISGRLQVAPTTMLLVGAAGAFVRWSAMALDPRPELLPVLQCLHGLSFGATHLGTVGFIVRATPPDSGATAQGCLAVALGTVTAAAMGLSGLLYASWGALAYGAMALMAGVGGLSALAVHRMARR